MRGPQTLQGGIFSYVSLESRIPEDHPLRAIRRLVDAALEQLSRRFDGIYAKGVGRPSVPPEQLLRALLLQVLYTIRSERQLIEQIDYNLLYRWFVGLELDDEVFSATVFTKNRERLLKGEIAQHFFEAVLAQAESEGLVSSEHFTVDGTLIEAWASQKSFVRKDEKRRDDDDPGNPTVNFRGEKRSNQTHASRTDPDARLAVVPRAGARPDRLLWEDAERRFHRPLAATRQGEDRPQVRQRRPARCRHVLASVWRPPRIHCSCSVL